MRGVEAGGGGAKLKSSFSEKAKIEKVHENQRTAISTAAVELPFQ